VGFKLGRNPGISKDWNSFSRKSQQINSRMLGQTQESFDILV
jgi:hypothetical protein